MPVPGYEFLPHTTDAYVQATGLTLERAFESAAAALFDTMCNVESVSAKMTETVRVEGEDEVILLNRWLEALLLKFELERKVFSQFTVQPIQVRSEGLHLTAEVSGEMYDGKKHGAKVEVKAITFHRMEVERTDTLTTVRFIVDL
jgi:SHS2 domain-containing protein